MSTQIVTARYFRGPSGFYKSTNPGLSYWVVLPIGGPNQVFYREWERTKHALYEDLGIWVPTSCSMTLALGRGSIRSRTSRKRSPRGTGTRTSCMSTTSAGHG